MTKRQDPGGREQVRLIVPQLVERPMVGGGCCGFAASDLIRETAEQIAGVRVVDCDDATGEVCVEFDHGSHAVVDAMSALDLLGYPVTAVTA